MNIAFKQRWAVALAALLMAGAFGLDLVLPPGYSDWPLYLFSIIVAAWVVRPKYSYVAAGLATFLTLVGLFLRPARLLFHLALINHLVMIMAIWIVALIVIQRRRAKKEIHNLARFPDENPNPVLRFTPQGILLYANESSRTMLRDCIGEIGAAGPESWVKVVDETFSNGMSSETEFTCGNRIFSMLYVPIREEGYVNVYGRDITERKRAEQALLEQSERTRAIVETAVDGIITIDESGVIQSVNPSIQRIFGYAPEEMMGQNVALLMPEPYHDEHNQYIADYLRTGMKKVIGIGREVMGKRKDGAVFPLDLAVSEIVLDGRRLFTGLVRDITERKQVEKQLNETLDSLTRSNTELEQFAYVASHDLQEPLRMVASYVQLLARRYQGKLDAEADEFIHYATDGAFRMQRLIQDLLTLSRVGTSMKEFKPLDLQVMFEQAKENLHLIIQESGAVITAQPLPVIHGDESQLVQLFQNLLDNAIKFRGKAAPRVHVSSRMEDRQWIVTMQDNGIGIDPKYFDRIFLVFQRLHGKDKYPGTGIGLAICKKIVERHGGEIWVGHEQPEGTTFHFTLPAL